MKRRPNPYPFQIAVDGVIYEIRRGRRDMKADGDCERPRSPGRRRRPIIRIRRGLAPHDEARVLLHELLHAADWNLSEDFVDETSATLVEALQKADLLRVTVPRGAGSL